jgi:hypothetical protein
LANGVPVGNPQRRRVIIALLGVPSRPRELVAPLFLLLAALPRSYIGWLIAQGFARFALRLARRVCRLELRTRLLRGWHAAVADHLLGERHCSSISSTFSRPSSDSILAAPSDEAAALELTYNWDPEPYTGGRNFGHLAYAVDNIYDTCSAFITRGVTIKSQAYVL